MKNFLTLLLLAMIPLTALQNTDLSPVHRKASTIIADADALIDPMPSQPLSVSKGRGLGDILLTINTLALGIDAPSGLSWDGQYLYVVSLLNDSVYVVDPFVPSVVNKWATDVFAASPYGCGIEQNIWVTHISPDTAREYTLAGVATGNAFSTEPCGATYCGDGSEWWQNGEIWFVGIGTGCGNQCIKFSVPTGTVLGTMGNAAWTYTSQRGMTYDPYNAKFWVGGWNSDSVWELNLDGSPTGRTFYMDGCAGIAYDWQSTYYPTPVLWITRQGADQIVMVDADNPNPSSGPVLWDFETGLQGWTHTNGLAFPAGWDVEPSNYKPAWTPPDAGDSTMWIDSDAAGSSVLVEDTAWSPAVVPPTNMAWLKYGLGYNNLTATSDSLYVGVRTFSGGGWNTPVQLIRYSADYGPAWDSLDVTAYNTADSIRVYFYYSGMYDWYAAFDNVGLYAPPGEDVGVTAILEPVGAYSLNDVVTPQAQVRNFGQIDDTFPVIFTMTRNAVMVYADTVDVTLTAGAIDTAVFTAYTFTQAGNYDIVSYTELVGDENPLNDTAYATAHIFEWVEDFETTTGGFVADPPSGAWEWGVPTSGPMGAHSGTNVWATVLDTNYSSNANWKLTSQDQYTATVDSPHIFFFHWYDIETGWDGGNVKFSTDNGTTWVLLYPVDGYDGVANAANAGIPAESCFTGHPTVWDLEEIIIPVNTGQAFNLRFHFGTDGSVTYPGWYVDDLAGIGLTVGISEEPSSAGIVAFGFAPRMSTLANDHVAITYSTTVQGHVSLQVYDGIGRLVQTLVNAEQPAGEKSLVWNRTDMNGRAVANGVYFLRLEAEGHSATHKMIFVR